MKSLPKPLNIMIASALAAGLAACETVPVHRVVPANPPYSSNIPQNEPNTTAVQAIRQQPAHTQDVIAPVSVQSTQDSTRNSHVRYQVDTFVEESSQFRAYSGDIAVDTVQPRWAGRQVVKENSNVVTTQQTYGDTGVNNTGKGLVGALVGGVIGSQFGNGYGRVATSAAGAAIGAMVGSSGSNSTCTASVGGAIAGAVVGGMIGSSVGQGSGRNAAAALGSTAGALLGSQAGNRCGQ